MGLLVGLYRATYSSSDFGKGSLLLLCDIMSELLVEGEKGKGCIILSFFAKSLLHSAYGNLEYPVKGKGTSFLNED